MQASSSSAVEIVPPAPTCSSTQSTASTSRGTTAQTTAAARNEEQHAAAAANTLPVTANAAQDSSGSADPCTASIDETTAEQRNSSDQQQQQKLEDSLNAAMAGRASRFRLHLVCGDFVKQLSGKRALKGVFNVATVGVMHAHLLRSQHKLGDVLAPDAVVLVEGAQNLVQVRLFRTIRF
jgi:hypothetical protein